MTPRCDRPSDRLKPAILPVALHPVPSRAGLGLLRTCKSQLIDEPFEQILHCLDSRPPNSTEVYDE